LKRADSASAYVLPSFFSLFYAHARLLGSPDGTIIETPLLLADIVAPRGAGIFCFHGPGLSGPSGLSDRYFGTRSRFDSVAPTG
jgi:hypothetical protein